MTTTSLRSNTSPKAQALILAAAIAIAVALNAIIAAVAIAAGAPATYPPLALPIFTAYTVIPITIGWFAWLRIRRTAKNPRRLLLVLATVVLALSFIPNIVLLMTGFIQARPLPASSRRCSCTSRLWVPRFPRISAPPATERISPLSIRESRGLMGPARKLMSSDDTAPVPSPVTVDDYRAQAEEAMPDDYRLYVNNVDMEATLRGDLDAWQRLRVRPRALVDVSRRSTATTVLGQQIALPVISAPYVGSMLVHPDGEVAVARGCTAADTITTLSMMASRTPEEVGSVAAGRYWQQLYWPADRSILEDVVRRAFAAGASALCLTVDLPVSPWFPRAMRSAAESVSAQLGDGARAMFLARDYGAASSPQPSRTPVSPGTIWRGWQASHLSPSC
ncbi:DUF6069 family protein [Arthrobacter sp. SD76]|uniref:DUF6069 family protein n=1 Tax=Arthrobacter sp. SD76 TaxID=3415007 RepID=UPI003C709BB4